MNENRRDWVRYFSCFILSFFLLLTILFWGNKIPYSSEIDVTSANYLLSASFQGLAAVLALVVSLTLVSAQMASTTYTPRFIENFVRFSKNPYFFGLLILYISSMLYNLLVLNWITKIDYIKYTDYAFFLCSLCLVYLVPYIFNTIKMVSPEAVLKGIRKDVKGYKETISGKYLMDKVVPQVDTIIRSAFKIGDYATFKAGLDTYGLIASEIVKKTGYSPMITEFIFGNISNIFLITVDDPRAPKYIMNSLSDLAENDLKEGKEGIAWRCAREIGEIGEKIIELGHKETSSATAYYLNHIGLLAAEKEKGWTAKVVIERSEKFALKVIEAKMDEEKKQIIIERTIDGIRDTGRKAKTRGLNYKQVVISDMAAESIERLKQIAEKKNLAIIVKYCKEAVSLINQV
jgi:hypothetical protein